MRRAALLAASILLFAPVAAPDDDPEVKRILAEIAGKEKLPAGQVFKNVKLLKDVPAARFLRIMDAGYSQALGVMCDHCHVEDRFDADEKRPKLAAREMIVLTREINDQLAKMENIDTSEATVNCTTCHRGYVKPAIQMR
ncbi:MAG TPA: c-type cytochrome [Thermoanaerobaculia bacterium]|nr:c-type cytochrome [Thermoanaerobaculia bacterium]